MDLHVRVSPQLTWYLTPHSRTGTVAWDTAAPSLMALSPARLDASFRIRRYDLLLGRAMLTRTRTPGLTWILSTSSAMD